MLKQEVYNKYLSINLLDRYKSLSNTFNSKEVMEEFDNDVVLSYLKEYNNHFTFNKKEGFFGLKELVKDFEFRFNLSFKYGMVEPIIWAKNVCTEEQFGGALIRLTKLIQITAGSKIERIMYPRFNSYDDIKKVTEELYELYEDFKHVIAFTI